MDNSAPGADRSTIIGYGPNRALAATAGVAAVVFLGLILATDDRAGRVLYAAAALVLLTITVRDLLWNPRLVISSAGLRVHLPTARAEFEWAQVEEVRLDARSRYGLSSRTLEVDAGEQLFVFSRWSLGTDPTDVHHVIEAFLPPLG